MQKKCKKMQKLLHISKKSSTFVADIGIVRIRTIKYYRVMDKLCIFRVYGGHNCYRVFRKWILGVGIVYDVYKDRRRISGVCRYRNLDEATQAAISLAEADLYFISDGENIK